MENEVTLGNNWNSEMSFSAFCDLNKFPTRSEDVQLLFCEIWERYVKQINERKTRLCQGLFAGTGNA